MKAKLLSVYIKLVDKAKKIAILMSFLRLFISKFYKEFIGK